MTSATPPPADPTAQRVPYAQASPQQVSRALLFVQEELQQTFPTLPWVSWADAFLTVQPDLWVGQETVSLDEQGLAPLAQHLASLPDVRDDDSIVHGHRVVYLAQKLVNLQDDAIYALADIEADPLAFSLPVCQLVTRLAVGNAVAEQVYRATRRGPEGRPGGEDPALARANVHARVQAVRRARGVLGAC
jgi:hypothetical protein